MKINAYVMLGTLVLAAGVYPGAWAAGPYAVDDAWVVESSVVQNENWVTVSDQQHSVVVTNIGYQLLPNAEFALQGMHSDAHGDRADTISPQVKYLWWQDPSGKSASSIVMGANVLMDRSESSSFYAYVPLSIQFTDTLKTHLNLGALHSRDTSQTDGTWGIGLEYTAHHSVSLVAETFGRQRAEPGYQFGSRVTVTDGMLLDIVYGWNAMASQEHTGTVGVTFGF